MNRDLFDEDDQLWGDEPKKDMWGSDEIGREL